MPNPDEPQGVVLTQERRTTLIEMLPNFLIATWKFWRGEEHPLLEARRERAQKIGRNELCPCGSGKKYKRCCGAAASFSAMPLLLTCRVPEFHAMSASLSPAQIAQYSRDGFLFPVDCLTQDEVRHYRGRLETFEREQGDTFGKLPDLVRSKSHLLFTWMDELVRHPKVLDAVESIIGPNILIYHLTSWLKEPNEPSHVSWHQDGTYFGLEPAEQVTAWIALTDATPEMGCVRIIPGSHAIGQRPHKDTFSPGNLLSRGQTIEHRLDYANSVMMPLDGRADITAPHPHRALVRA